MLNIQIESDLCGVQIIYSGELHLFTGGLKLYVKSGNNLEANATFINQFKILTLTVESG